MSVSRFNGVDVLRTFFLNSFLAQTKIIVYKKAIVEKTFNSKIYGSGKVHFGKLWGKKAFKSSLLYLGKESALHLKGTFSIFTGAQIYINDNAVLELGSGYINEDVRINCFKKISIGHNVAISNDVIIRDSDNHQLSSKSTSATAPIVIEDNVWIGMRVIILKGVTIGEGSVIAAGSVINQNVPPYTLVGGNPFKIIRTNISWS